MGVVLDDARFRIDTLLLDRWETDLSRPALVVGDHVITRGELRSQVLRVAGALRARGVLPGDRVAVYLERSAAFVFSILGVVVAGGAHVAIDVHDPPRRTARMIEDSAPRVVITDPEHRPNLPAGAEIVMATEGGSPALAPSDVVTADQPAVVIYTSGSTGRPKASLISHRALASRLAALQRTHRLDENDRTVLHTVCSFDMFLIEVYWPLLAGATVVVAAPGRHRDADYLAGLIHRWGITSFYCVVSLLELFMTTRRPGERFDGLRQVLTGGEPLSPELVRRFHAASTASLTNLYGPSECTIYCTAWECPRNPELDKVLIGSAIPDTVLWILGPDGRPVPDGEAGELHIGGAGLALGYLSRPGVTADRFVPDHLGGTSSRLYRSGDLVRKHPAGGLEFLGRVDRQVKVRGIRIELGEIEATALRCAGVGQAAVVAHGEGSRKRLCAFLVGEGDVTNADLVSLVRTTLRTWLPQYMVPATITVVDALPLTANGKLDRDRLAERAACSASSAETVPAGPVAGTDLETVVAGVWQVVLGMGDIDPNEEFFDLGGDSFKAVRVVKRLTGLLGVDIPTLALLDNPTVKGMSAELGRLMGQEL